MTEEKNDKVGQTPYIFLKERAEKWQIGVELFQIGFYALIFAIAMASVWHEGIWSAVKQAFMAIS
jgi:hypothetical protein